MESLNHSVEQSLAIRDLQNARAWRRDLERELAYAQERVESLERLSGLRLETFTEDDDSNAEPFCLNPLASLGWLAAATLTGFAGARMAILGWNDPGDWTAWLAFAGSCCGAILLLVRAAEIEAQEIEEDDNGCD